MTHVPTAPVSQAPPAPALPPGLPPETPRRRAWAEGAARLRAAARTEPGRLRLIGAVIAVLLLLFGALTAWQVGGRAATTGTVINDSQPLSANAASIYRSLADANTTAAAGFLAGGEEPRSVREGYERNIATAAELLAAAAAHSAGSEKSQEHIERLNRELPVYTGLVETARTNNRQGLPLGGAYLRYADERMQEEILPVAADLYALENESFHSDLDDAASWPWAALGSGLLALTALAWAQRRHFLRTNRVFNPGLLAATAAVTMLMLWLTAAHGLARASLQDADQEAARSLSVLNEAWAQALQARANESLTLVARGAGGAFEENYQDRMAGLAGGPAREGGAEDGTEASGGLLGEALELADDEAGSRPVQEAVRSAEEWRARHREARSLENAGEYEAAVEQVIGTAETVEGSTGEAFDEVDASLKEAVRHEQGQFDATARRGRSVLSGLTAGAAGLGLLGAVAAVTGIGRRLSEFR